MSDQNSDKYELTRFVAAQELHYSVALQELRQGKKESHWMWFIFPQIAGIGYSQIARHFAISSTSEASAYLMHPLLGQRLLECCEAVLAIDSKTAHEIFGSPDDLKLHACVTLFSSVSPTGSVFHQIIDKYFAGKKHMKTVSCLEAN
ncbi:MAG: DUF1810 domain-containing protein [Pseudohongiella sp.]|nr:DUF1810 domain-containing protein [Pseudohongiella sp.]